MKTKNALLALALALVLCAAPALAMTAEEAAVYGHLGEALPDFTVATVDGGTFTLSEALSRKEMVLINLWATWCGPCEMEFPYMQEAYEQYQDKVEIIALSVDPSETDDLLAAYAEEHGMTFPVASDTSVGLGGTFATMGIPTTLVVDRFGNIAFIEVGSQPATSAFTSLFDHFTGDDYTETATLEAIPPARPTVSAADPVELAAALNAEDGALVFTGSDDAFVWPMIPAERDGRGVLVSTNAGENESRCGVYWTGAFQEGDAFAFTFATSTETAMDLLQISVDGETVKVFGGEHDWTEWAVAMEPGEHEIGFEYVKDYSGEAGEDCVWLDEVRLVSGDEAASLLAALPAAPAAAELSVELLAPNAREIVFQGDEDGLLAEYFSCQSYWIVSGELVEADAFLPAGVDPEAAFGYSNYDDVIRPLVLNEAGNGYRFSTGIDSAATTGYNYTNLYLYSTADVASMDDFRGMMLFAGEEEVNAFVQEMSAEIALTWAYADGSAPSTDAPAAAALPASGEYTVVFEDQNGEPVPGCIVNFCTDVSCVPCVADENGVATFVGEPYAYHLQVIQVPEGYEFDTAQEFTADPAGGEMRFTVIRK